MRVSRAFSGSALFCGGSLCFLCALLSPGLSFSQTNAPNPNTNAASNPTRIGTAVETKGSLVVQDRKTLGVIKGEGRSTVTVIAISTYNPDTPGDKTKGFEVDFYDERQVPDSVGPMIRWYNAGVPFADYTRQAHSAFIDDEEARNLVKALAFMSARAIAWDGKDVGDKSVHFHGTDAYEFFLDHWNEKGKPKQQYTAYGGNGDYSRVTFRTNADINALERLFEDGLDWLAKPR